MSERVRESEGGGAGDGRGGGKREGEGERARIGGCMFVGSLKIFWSIVCLFVPWKSFGPSPPKKVTPPPPLDERRGSVFLDAFAATSTFSSLAQSIRKVCVEKSMVWGPSSTEPGASVTDKGVSIFYFHERHAYDFVLGHWAACILSLKIDKRYKAKAVHRFLTPLWSY